MRLLEEMGMGRGMFFTPVFLTSEVISPTPSQNKMAGFTLNPPRHIPIVSWPVLLFENREKHEFLHKPAAERGLRHLRSAACLSDVRHLLYDMLGSQGLISWYARSLTLVLDQHLLCPILDRNTLWIKCLSSWFHQLGSHTVCIYVLDSFGHHISILSYSWHKDISHLSKWPIWWIL